MSKVVENQVVQMQFDNKEFQKNVDASMKSLDTFKGKMDFKDSSKSFGELEKASEKVNFEKLNQAIDGLSDHFTVFGRTFYKITDQIADYFASKITGAVNAVKSITTDIIDPKAGYAKYDAYTNGVKTILYALTEDQKSNLLKTYDTVIEGVEDKLSELMWYTDETSYNFTDMVNTVGKFMGSGLNLDDAIKDMQGIANWAALSGQNAATASQAMYQLSQALGRGNLQYMDWAQAANLKNMGTTAAKDVFIEAARKQGYIQDKDIEYAKKQKGEDRSQWRNYFFETEALNENAWFKTSVLEAGLQEFSKASSMIANIQSEFEDTEYSATNVLKALDHIAGKGVAKAVSAEEAAANLLKTSDPEKIKKMAGYLKTLASEEYKLGREAFAAAQKAYTFNDAIEATKDAVGTKWSGIFTQLVGNAEEASELWTKFANSLWDIFAGPLDNVYWGLKEWGKLTVKSVDEYGNEIEISVRKHLWEGVAETFSAIGEVFGELANTIKSTIHFIRTGSYELEELSDEQRTNRIVNFFEALRNGIHNLATNIKNFTQSTFFQNLMEFIRSFGLVVRPIVKGLKQIGQAILKGLGKTPAEGVNNLLKAFTNLNTSLGKLLEKFIGSKGFKKILTFVTGKVKTMASVVKMLIDFFKDLTDESVGLRKAFKNLNTSFGSILDSIKDTVYQITGMDISIITDNIKKVGTFITDKVPIFLEAAGATIGSLVKNIANDIFGNIPDAWNTMCDTLENGTPGEKLKAVLVFLGGRLQDGIQAIIDTIEDLTGADLSGFSDKLTSFFDKIAKMLENFQPGFDKGWEAVKGIMKDLGSVFKDLASAIFTVIGQITGIENMGPDKILDLIFWILEKFAAVVIWIVGALSKAISAAGPYLNAVADIIANGFGQIAKAFNYLIGVDKSPEALKSLNNIKKALGVVIAILVLLEVVSFYRKVKWFIESSANLADLISGKIIKQTVLQQITAFIKAIGTIMIAIAILANQDIGGIAMSVVALGVVIKIISNTLTTIMKQVKLMANNIAKNKLSDKQISALMNGVTKVITAVGKIASRIAIAVLIMSIADKINSGKLTIERSMVALSVAVLAITKGLSWIFKSLQSAKITDAEIKQANKVLKTMTKALFKIAVDLAIVGAVMNGLHITGKNGDKSTFQAMFFLGSMTLVMALAVQVICQAVKGVKADSLNSAAKLIGKMSMGLIKVSLGLWVLMEVLDKAALADKGLELIGIGMAAIVGSVIAMGIGMALLNKITPGASKAGEKANKALDKLVGAVAKAIGKMLGMNSTLVVMVGSVLAAVGTAVLLTMAFKKWGAKVALGLAATALLFLGFAGLMKLISKIKIEDKLPSILTFVGVMAMMVGAVLVLSGTLALLTLVAQMPGFGAAIVAMGVMMGALLGLALIAPKLNTAVVALSGFGLAALEIAGGMLLFAAAMKMLAEIPQDQMELAGEAILKFLGILFVLIAVATFIPAVATGISIVAGAFAAIGIGVLALVAAVFLLTLLADSINVVTEKLLELSENLGPLLDAIVVLVVAIIQGLADSILEHADELASALVDAALAVAVLVIAAFVKIVERIGQALWDAVQEAGDGLINFLGNMWEWIFHFPEKLHEVFGNLRQIIEDFVGNGFLGKLLKGITWGIEAMIQAFMALPAAIMKIFGWILERLYDLLGIHSPSKVFADMGKNMFLGLINGLTGTVKAVIDCIKSVVGTIIGWFKKLFGIHSPSTIFSDMGMNLLKGLINGIKNFIPNAINTIKSFGKNILNTFAGVLGINSPSVEFFKDGIYIVKGLVNGISSGGGDAVNAVKKLGTEMLGAFMPTDGLASALNMEGIAQTFQDASFGNFDLATGLNSDEMQKMMQANGTYTPQLDGYAFQDQLDGMDHIYDLDMRLGGSSSKLFEDGGNLTLSPTQLADINSNYDDGSQKIVDAVNDLGEQVAAQAKAISEIKLVLDTGVVVGELSGPIDKYLGNLKNKKERTGVGFA